MSDYDLLVYHDFSDDTKDSPQLAVGDNAGSRFGSKFAGLYVTAFGRGIHDGRTTVVLSEDYRPEMQQELKAYFNR